MERDPQERLTLAFKHLREGLEKFVCHVLETKHGKDWERLALSVFPSNHPIQEQFSRTRVIEWDIAALLSVIDNRWHQDFKQKLGRHSRNWVKELRNARNQWAHQSTMDSDLVWRAIDSAERLLLAAGITDHAVIVKNQKAGLIGQLTTRQNQKPTQSPLQGTAPLPATRPRKNFTITEDVFELCLQPTYYKSGFFNISVAFNNLVRQSDGEITLTIEPEGKEIPAKVNRRCNTNGTPRIMGGVPLRDWFFKSCTEKQTLYVDFPSTHSIRISKDPFKA